ncbi:uncharacterized protein LOC102802193 [Saccoglossus kowalevskii]|uniref:Uncharacterized protein LOC102802193 n=1 Tax=Saccoglossus kowalevskii TaxID=10224 RepID=A0ABM0MIK0_SACKO|nr:PREDICTED: uncharacterized protein LOC102802193 [Saccoglossus kowalevskii]
MLHNPIFDNSVFGKTVKEYPKKLDFTFQDPILGELNGTISEDEIMKALIELKPEISPGPDSIPNEFYRCSKNALIPVLKFAVNAIFDAGIFPEEWAKRFIVPLHEKCNVQKYLSKSKGWFYCMFVDFSKTFDSVNHNLLMYRLYIEGGGGKMLNILKSMYKGVKSCVKCQSGITNYFPCNAGVRQGCA